MAIKNVIIEEGCIACGTCESICPKVFKVEDHSTIIPGADFVTYDAQIRQAVESCPMGVIKIVEG